MEKAEYFKIFELVDPETYEARGQKAWELIDSRLITVIDRLRAIFGPATINDWKWGGKFKWSGLRTNRCRIGAKYSQHRFGRAADLKFKNVSAQEVRDFIKADPIWPHVGVRCVEKDVSWLHVDVRNCEPIKWVKP